MEYVNEKDMMKNAETMNSMNSTKSANTVNSTKTQDMIFILDESGSMGSMGTEPKDSVNRIVKEQKALNIPGSKFTLVKFNNNVKIVYDDVPLEDMPEYTDYNPSDMTALYDAIGIAITNKMSKGEGNYNNVICVILTDGLENCSRYYSLNNPDKDKSIKKLIKKMEDNYSWNFIYAAANQDAFGVGQTMGLNNCTNWTPTQEGILELSREISGGIARFRSGDSATIEIKPSDDADDAEDGEDMPFLSLTQDIPVTPPNLIRTISISSPPPLKRQRRTSMDRTFPIPPNLIIPDDVIEDDVDM
jgi:hypothetical protein